jgi:hypothetical protein
MERCSADNGDTRRRHPDRRTPPVRLLGKMVLPVGIEPTTFPLPRVALAQTLEMLAVAAESRRNATSR